LSKVGVGNKDKKGKSKKEKDREYQNLMSNQSKNVA
jgi:hypothetical protein